MSTAKDNRSTTETSTTPTLHISEVIRRFSEVSLISDTDLRVSVIRTLSHAPEYFWEVPASASKKYHNPFCRGQHGLWIHTKMAVTSFERVSNSWEELGLLSEYQRDCGLAALLLHDMFKQGYPTDRDSLPESDQTTVKNHDELMAEWCRDHTSLPTPVIGAIESHNGPWYGGTEPSLQRLLDIVRSVRQTESDPTAVQRDLTEFMVELIVHTCDMAASDPNGTLGVWKPAEEIREKYPNLPRAHFPHAE